MNRNCLRHSSMDYLHCAWHLRSSSSDVVFDRVQQWTREENLMERLGSLAGCARPQRVSSKALSKEILHYQEFWLTDLAAFCWKVPSISITDMFCSNQSSLVLEEILSRYKQVECQRNSTKQRSSALYHRKLESSNGHGGFLSMELLTSKSLAFWSSCPFPVNFCLFTCRTSFTSQR